jgi:hypothetical protein
VPAAGWVVQDHPEITPPSNFHQLRDTTNGFCHGLSSFLLKSGQAFLGKQMPYSPRTASNVLFPSEMTENGLLSFCAVLRALIRT